MSDAALMADAFLLPATVQKDSDTSDTGEPLQEVVIEARVVRAHDDEQLGIRK